MSEKFQPKEFEGFRPALARRLRETIRNPEYSAGTLCLANFFYSMTPTTDRSSTIIDGYSKLLEEYREKVILLTTEQQAILESLVKNSNYSMENPLFLFTVDVRMFIDNFLTNASSSDIYSDKTGQDVSELIKKCVLWIAGVTNLNPGDYLHVDPIVGFLLDIRQAKEKFTKTIQKYEPFINASITPEITSLLVRTFLIEKIQGEALNQMEKTFDERRNASATE